MKVSALVLLHFCLSCHSATAQKLVVGELGQSLLLPCYSRPANLTHDANTTTSVLKPMRTLWFKDGEVKITHNHSDPHLTNHLNVLNDSSLYITSVMKIDEGVYRCEPEPKRGDLPLSLELRVADGPTNMDVQVKAAHFLPNGTGYVQKGADVAFSCSSQSYPSQNLTWTFKDGSSNETIEAFNYSTSLEFKIFNIQETAQGNYTCRAQNLVSDRVTTKSLELLVYYAPERHPDCSWELASQPDQVHFNCTWHGGYPAPLLSVILDVGQDRIPKLVNSSATENLGVTLNRSMMFEGQYITCAGQHKAGDRRNCSFTLKAPYPTGEPLVATLEGSNVTLQCTESSSLPPAKTKWQKGKNHQTIQPSSKYVLSEQGPNLFLTIVNVTKEDAGEYFCWSENLLTAKELEVYVTVRSSADNSGAVVGVFLSVLIVAAGITLGTLAYSRRDRICLSFPFGRLEEDRTDVVSLVESDEEEVFRDAVPRLPPLVNGHVPTTHSTTLVEIHQIQSSDHEDNVNETEQADQDYEQQDE